MNPVKRGCVWGWGIALGPLCPLGAARLTGWLPGWLDIDLSGLESTAGRTLRAGAKSGSGSINVCTCLFRRELNVADREKERVMVCVSTCAFPSSPVCECILLFIGLSFRVQGSCQRYSSFLIRQQFLLEQVRLELLRVFVQCAHCQPLVVLREDDKVKEKTAEHQMQSAKYLGRIKYVSYLLFLKIKFTVQFPS